MSGRFAFRPASRQSAATTMIRHHYPLAATNTLWVARRRPWLNAACTRCDRPEPTIANTSRSTSGTDFGKWISETSGHQTGCRPCGGIRGSRGDQMRASGSGMLAASRSETFYEHCARYIKTVPSQFKFREYFRELLSGRANSCECDTPTHPPAFAPIQK